MNIVIVGAGSMGSYLATVLSQEGHNVLIIEEDEKTLEKIGRSADIATKLGSGTDPSILEEVKEISPDFFIAMSNHDETNLTACAIAKSLGYPKTVARIRQNFFLEESRAHVHRLFSVDHLIGTELVVAHDIVKIVANPGSLVVENFAHGAVQMRTLVVEESFPDKAHPLSEMKWLDNFLIGLIRRQEKKGQARIIFPKGNDLLLPGDEVTVFGKTSAMNELYEIFGMPQKNTHSVVLFGGSGIAIHLAKLLIEKKIHVKIIERNEQKCIQLAKLFPSMVIINHDGTDLHFLEEEGVPNSDFFIACTSSHETNVLAAIVGRQAGCKEVIALVSEESIIPLLQKFQISYALSERKSIARKVQLILHEEALISLASLYDNDAIIVEARISTHSRLVNIPLSELREHLPKKMLIAMVKNKQGICIPKGNTILQAGDTVIVICGPESIQKLRMMF